jgi:hypothetical protein
LLRQSPATNGKRRQRAGPAGEAAGKCRFLLLARKDCTELARLVGHDDPEICRGRNGIAFDRGDHTEIGLCTREVEAHVEFLILHELAHAYEHQFVSDEVREEFLELRGLERWRGSDLAWHEAGAEHTAEILVWGLMDRPVWIVRIDDVSCEELMEGYDTLTGSVPVHGYTDYCD